ncbi:MAG: hypothetical protein ACYTEQ_01215 [Planctomycetota bacterium]|jgi:hypothetical protein
MRIKTKDRTSLLSYREGPNGWPAEWIDGEKGYEGDFVATETPEDYRERVAEADDNTPRSLNYTVETDPGAETDWEFFIMTCVGDQNHYTGAHHYIARYVGD